MPMSLPDVTTLVADVLLPAFQAHRSRMDRIDRWYRHDPEEIELPKRSTSEAKALARIASTPFLGLVVTNVSQCLFVDGYKSPDAEGNAGAWSLWQSNDLDARQVAVHRAMLAYGTAYGTALPGLDPLTNERTAILRGVSPRKMLAFYADPAEDDWPLYAIRVDTMGTSSNPVHHVTVYDDEAVYRLGYEDGLLKPIEWEVHGVGVCPVVRFTNMLDLDGRSDGEVEPFIPLAQRINKTTFDRLLIQHFNSFKVRTATGLAEPETPADAEAAKLRIAHDSVLTGEEGVTFGTLPETSMDSVVRASEWELRTLAAATQTPVHAMVGDLINLSAEALAAARSALDAKVEERQRPTGKAHRQWLRLGLVIAPDLATDDDEAARVTWADTSLRSMAEAADALGKMSTMLGIPPRALWSRIPGVTKNDVDEWEQMADRSDPLDRLLDELIRGTEPPELEAPSPAIEAVN